MLVATLAALLTAPACSGASDARPTLPHSTTRPAVVGAPTVGKPVRAKVGRWKGHHPVRLAIAWERCDPSSGHCKRIKARWKRTYVPSLADVGLSLAVRVTARNHAGRVTRTSRRSRPVTPGRGSRVLFLDTFNGRDGLVTNEYAFFNPSDTEATHSLRWEMTSGSLFRQGGTGWTGRPTRGEPDRRSTSENDSAIFRLRTRRADFGDVAVRFRLRNDGLREDADTPAVAWDGVHVFLRYQSQYHLYYASVNRRDNTAVIKKKCVGGPSNGGTYYTLGESVAHPVPYGRWQDVVATVENDASGGVSIALTAGGQHVVSTRDDGIGCDPIRSPGAVGIRGDNAEFHIEDFEVETLRAERPARPAATPDRGPYRRPARS